MRGRPRRWLAPALLVALGCQRHAPDWPALELEIRERFPTVSQLDLDTYEREHAERALLVDVRSDAEFAVSHIAGAVHAQTPEAVAAALQASEKSELVLYCSVGWRSSAMAERVAGLVDVPVHNLEGSIFAWANSGRPVVRDGEVVREVHPFDEEWGRLLDERYRRR
jgi:rhodanese-related sulfurtransferase